MSNYVSQAGDSVVPARESGAGEHVPPQPARRQLRRIRPTGPYASIWIATLVLFVLSWILVPKSMTAQSLNAMIPFWALLAIIAIGQTLVIQQRGIDLSVPGMVTLSAMVFVAFVDRNHTSIVVGLVVVVAVAALAGLLNGLIITKVNVTPLITTLAVNALLVGAMFSYTHGVPSSAPPGLQSFTGSTLLGISVLAWIAVGFALIVAFVVNRTKTGRRFVAVGASPAAARALGIRVDAYTIGAYVFGAICFAVAAVLLAGYTQTPTSSLGNPYLFQSVMAVVIGGTSVAGGRGSVLASVVAALFLTQLGQVVLTLGAASSIQLLVQAVAMAVAMGAAALVASRRQVARG
jgi:ribose transport system permease protein